jgi:DNA-directed RNA polymerase specialized sigma subunit
MPMRANAFVPANCREAIHCMADMEAHVRTLAGRGLSAAEIANWLGVPENQVQQVLDADQGEDSFPASDPPPAPLR